MSGTDVGPEWATEIANINANIRNVVKFVRNISVHSRVNIYDVVNFCSKYWNVAIVFENTDGDIWDKIDLRTKKMAAILTILDWLFNVTISAALSIRA